MTNGAIYQLGPMRFSKLEVRDLLAAWAAISIAFAVLYSGRELSVFALILPMCLATVGLGFLLHELGHKALAQHYGMWAEFRANYQGLIFAVLLSFAGFIFAAPGAVWTAGQYASKTQEGLISLMGPLANIILAICFLAVYLNPLADFRYVQIAGWLGYHINTWLALFNLIPAPSFDGKKIWGWSKPAYLATAAATCGLYAITYLI